jgi:hypothetical protein
LVDVETVTAAADLGCVAGASHVALRGAVGGGTAAVFEGVVAPYLSSIRKTIIHITRKETGDARK